jgi:multisubunit Na+/H+ antiporter MnhF subunit
MRQDNNLSGHILPTSGAMLGVCMTVISIVKLTQSNRGFASWVDDVLALDALIFLTSSIFSYLSIRSKSKKVYFEDIADKMFMLALILMGASVLLLTYEIV